MKTLYIVLLPSELAIVQLLLLHQQIPSPYAYIWPKRCLHDLLCPTPTLLEHLYTANGASSSQFAIATHVPEISVVYHLQSSKRHTLHPATPCARPNTIYLQPIITKAAGTVACFTHEQIFVCHRKDWASVDTTETKQCPFARLPCSENSAKPQCSSCIVSSFECRDYATWVMKSKIARWLPQTIASELAFKPARRVSEILDHGVVLGNWHGLRISVF